MAFPTLDRFLVNYSTNFKTRIIATPLVYGLTQSQADSYEDFHNPYVSAVDALEAARAAGVRSEPLKAVRDAARAALLFYGRQLYGFVASSKSVSVAHKLELGVNPRTNPPAPRPAPVVQPAVSVKDVVGRTIRIEVTRAGGSQRPRREQNAVAAWVYYFAGETYPSDPLLWAFAGGASNGRIDVVIPDNVTAGTRVWICAAWVSQAQRTSPPSEPISTFIQAGGVSRPRGEMNIAA